MAKLQTEAAATTQATEDKEMDALREVRTDVLGAMMRASLSLTGMSVAAAEHGQVPGGRAEPRVPAGA